MGEMKPVGKRVWKLLVVLSVTCVGWGLLTNSFFGIDFTPDSAFRDNSVLSWLAKKKIAYHIEHGTTGYKEAITKYPQLEGSTDPSYFLMEGTRERDGQLIYELADSTANGIMMELALLFGIIHVSLGFIRYLGYNYSGIGWVIAIIGAWLYIPVYLDVPSILNYVVGIPADLAEKDGLYLMGGGFVLALSLAIYQNKLLGIFEMATVIQILADILSYLRLYALGLAGGIVSATVNNFAFQAGPILAIFPILIGHTINILLSIMGGIIHGLRLNFVEWYHYCFLGGGKRYTPLKRMAEES
jgi:V/A-type H+-transporting ATPase subunit I